ncbi:MAG: phosphoribosylformylglycinamidine synthase subunit PurQ [Myxococcota bacterium]|nr:phosphoribosylformylglycinamidine synthase subunit PurQ [Myxococcota bacterium]
MTQVAVITFPGSNCDADLRHAVDLVDGLESRAVWHKESSLEGASAVLLPGGFSYGDYLRCGAIARFSPIMAEVMRFAREGRPVLGICNGFQILTEAGLLPGALLDNSGQKFLCQTVDLRVEGRETPFTRTTGEGAQLSLPIAHQEGRYFADQETLARLEGEGQIVFRYRGGAPNGSERDIAGICSAAGNVVGLMPHPERVVEPELGGTDGLSFFQGLAESLA